MFPPKYLRPKLRKLQKKFLLCPCSRPWSGIKDAMDLFETQIQHQSNTPLSERLRPKRLEDFVGQKRALRQSGILALIDKTKSVPNLILWGPPGTGKTTFAQLLSTRIKTRWVSVSAIDTGAKRFREIGTQAHQDKLIRGESTLLFVDEIHRLNKGQQDVLLPYTEKGDVILVGATTENPSYELNAALLSRSRVLVFERLEESDLLLLLQRASAHLKIQTTEFLEEEAIKLLCSLSDGDGRRLMNLVETLSGLYEGRSSNGIDFPLSSSRLSELQLQNPMSYDKASDEHYDSISAFIKSVRGSDPDAAVYYLARMVEGGEDPVFIARRLVILASEDIGNADPRALSIAVSGLQAVELIGFPEAAISLAQVTTYLASAPKSNRSYKALKKAQDLVRQKGRLPIPLALRSSRTALNKSMGYGRDYEYSHDGPKGFVDQDFLPPELKEEKLYEPSDRGFEKNIKEYLKWMKS